MEQILVKISIMLVPALLAVTMHELSHGFFAEKFGDPTARLLGRLTLNPLKHLDPIGTLALLFFGFGWARPVPVNFNNLRNPKQNMIWVALAGPLSNFALALLSALLLRGLAVVAELKVLEGTLLQAAFEPIVLMVSFSLLINVILAVFNLIPVPPLDGGRVLTGILPKKQADMLARLEPFGFVIIIFVVFFTDVWRVFLYPLIWFVVDKLAGPQVGVVEYVMRFLFGN
ncbi:MAG: site-2 protease family protein [Desulfuromonadales bacterium]|uniref:site-2 protease family protein n=1 Tax=Desulfuromonas sp. KJ2020 TaxID=2919173 RepID=UPI000322F4EE|nr:site-2 protease family protein [Desulfuromonas sp. KJ2020]MCP3177608.1 site-2 protease family protein [Desulfuromonas sp. KJ2020]